MRKHGSNLATWLLALPLLVAGSEAAHALAYRLVYPDAHARLRDLLATGHGYLAYAPLLLGLAAGVELVAFSSMLLGAVRGRRAAPLSPWAFALMPPVGFALQELLERWLAVSAFPWWMVLQPTFRVGLLLQLPFALLAYVLARLLGHVAERVGHVLRRLRPVRATGSPRAWFAFSFAAPRLGALAGGYAGRGPPRSAGAHS